MHPAPFIRGRAFPPIPGVPYPRLKPDDASRVPLDTWARATIPVGVRLELVGDAEEVQIKYTTRTEDFGHRGEGAGRTFAVWRGGELVDEEKADLGEATIRVFLGSPPEERAIVYLPQGMRPEIHDVHPARGSIRPAPLQPRWVVYGDSVAEGWIASAPALAWPAIVGREHELDVINMGFGGAARGEIPVAEQIADTDPDAICIAYGTNCWARTAHSVGQVREGLRAFLEVIRQDHPNAPVVVVTPVVRPDAEDTPNRLGASLHAIRHVMQEVVAAHIDAGDGRMRLVRGRDVLDADMLGDGIHPNDDGHRALADAVGREVALMLPGAR
jgi:lysophospholipase L1-like esterase